MSSYDARTTNRDLIDRMGNTELSDKIKSLAALPGFQYIDWTRWLSSDNPDFPYSGDVCRFKPYAEMFAKSDWLYGIWVDTQLIAGIEHCLIMSNGALYKIPKNRVEKL